MNAPDLVALVHLVGFAAGIVLYGMLAVMIGREARRGSAVSPRGIPLLAAVLVVSGAQAQLTPEIRAAAKKEGRIVLWSATGGEYLETVKREAQKHHTQYQKMIRRLLDAYTQMYQQPPTRRFSRSSKARG